MASIIEVIGPYKIQVKRRGGAYVDLGRCEAGGLFRAELQIENEIVRTTEFGRIPKDVIYLGTTALIAFTLTDMDQDVCQNLFNAIPRLNAEAVAAGAWVRGSPGLKWSENDADVDAASGFFSVLCLPDRAGFSLKKREFKRCYLEGTPMQLSQIGHTSTLTGFVFNVLPDLVDRSIMLETQIP